MTQVVMMTCSLNPKADSVLFAVVLLLLQPIQIEEVDPVFQIGGGGGGV